MVFSSVGFLCLYLPAVFFLYTLAPQRWKNPFLAFASIIFYSWGEPRFVVLMLISVAINFRFGMTIDACTKPSRRLHLVALAVSINLALLAAFKYTNFIVENLNLMLAPAGRSLGTIAPIALPIGISFYTFHAISYLIDIHRGNARANSSIVQYALYIMLFPQLVAGPIIRYKDINAQLAQRRVTLDDINQGISRFTMGLAKKVLIANPLGFVADGGFDAPAAGLAAADAWLYLLAYSLQIYFDFSGYSDMAIGLARLFGFRFPENFRYPYTATSIQDFWRRWHISLSTWFRDYVYLPLGGNRQGELRTLRNLWIVFLLTGLWHGASWNFVIWGAIHGLFLTLERVGRHPAWRGVALPLVVRWAYVLIVVMIAWVFFRSSNISEAIDFSLALIGHWNAPRVGTSLNPFLMLFAVVLALGIYPRLLDAAKARFPGFFRTPVFECLDSIFVGPVLILCLLSLSVGRYNPFIYFRF